MVNTHKEKKTYITPETEIILFGEDIIATSGTYNRDDYETDIIPDNLGFGTE